MDDRMLEILTSRMLLDYKIEVQSVRSTN